MTPLAEVDVFVGIGLGKSFSFMCECEKAKNKTDLDSRVKDVVAANNSLREFNAAFPWFSTMMLAVLKNQLVPISSVNVVGMHEVSLKEGKDIGKGLGISIMSCQMSYAAVDDWILKSRALQDLDELFRWFR